MKADGPLKAHPRIIKPVLSGPVGNSRYSMVFTGWAILARPLSSATCRLPFSAASMSSNFRFLFADGVVTYSPDIPPVSTFLESRPGAYTTTRTHNGTVLLFWDRHLQRLSDSARILSRVDPQLLFKPTPPSSSSVVSWLDDGKIKALVSGSLRQVLPVALKESRRRRADNGEELAVTAIVSGDKEELRGGVDVCVHVGSFLPPLFGTDGARLAVVGRGRDVAEAKYTAWVRLRKPLEKLRPPSVTELLLSNDGDKILEGCVTNFFVVCRRDNSEVEEGMAFPFKVQTAPVSDGVLPGIIRQLVIEVCLSNGIPLQEIAPSWSKRELWQEAFITNGLRILQHVEKIQVPSSWESQGLKTLKELSWEEKQFGEKPGVITAMIQREIMKKAALEGCQF